MFSQCVFVCVSIINLLCGNALTWSGASFRGYPFRELTLERCLWVCSILPISCARLSFFAGTGRVLADFRCIGLSRYDSLFCCRMSTSRRLSPVSSISRQRKDSFLSSPILQCCSSKIFAKKKAQYVHLQSGCGSRADVNNFVSDISPHFPATSKAPICSILFHSRYWR